MELYEIEKQRSDNTQNQCLDQPTFMVSVWGITTINRNVVNIIHYKNFLI